MLECNPDFKPSFVSGLHLRGLFYRVLSSVDPSLSSRLHDHKTLSPFSISPLIRIGPGRYLFRVTSCLSELSDALVKTFSKMSKVELLNKSFHILEISYTRLDLEKLVKRSAPCRKYEIEFLSPTCFRRPSPYIPLHAMRFITRILKLFGKPKSHYRFLPLPDPILMLRNLKRQWDRYASLNLRARRFDSWLEGRRGRALRRRWSKNI